MLMVTLYNKRISITEWNEKLEVMIVSIGDGDNVVILLKKKVLKNY